MGERGCAHVNKWISALLCVAVCSSVLQCYHTHMNKSQIHECGRSGLYKWMGVTDESVMSHV